MKLRSKLVLVFGSVVIISTLIVSTLGYAFIQRQSVKSTENELKAQVNALKNDIDGWFQGQAKIAETVATTLTVGFDENTFDAAYFTRTMEIPSNKDVLLDLYLGTPSGKMFDGSGWTPDADYDPRERPWYQEAEAANGLIYTSAYVDAATNQYTISIALPVVGKDGQKIGVIAEDILLSTLMEKVSSLKIGETGYAILMDQDTLALSHPDEKIANTKLNEIDELKTLMDNMIKNGEGYEEYTYLGTDKIMVYETIPSTKWIMGVAIEKSEVYQDIYKLRNNYIILNIIVALLVAFIAYAVATNIVKPIQGLKACAETMAAGDVRVQANVNGSLEIRQLSVAFNTMANSISNLIQKINHSADIVTSSSTDVKTIAEHNGRIASEVSRTITELANGAYDQASSVSEGATAISEMSQSISEISQTGEQSVEMIEQVKTAVKSGYDAVIHQETLMNENKQSTFNVQQSISELNGKTEVIGQIVDVISSIANQTNLLALNAAIEAARAGEHGKGFAVVADEVRKLAEQSAESSNEIGKLLDDIRSKTKESVQEVMIVRDVVEKQEVALNQTKGDFDLIKNSVEKIVQQIYIVAETSASINQKATEVSSAITNVAAITQESAAATEEVSASTVEQVKTVEKIVNDSTHLVEEAESLMKEIQKFKF